MESKGTEAPSVHEDEHCLGELRRWALLEPLARAARKPKFALKPADGALDSHAKAVRECEREYRALARTILQRCGRTARA